MAIIDFPLPSDGAEPAWNKVLRVSVFATAEWRQGNGIVRGLRFHAIGYTIDDRDEKVLGKNVDPADKDRMILNLLRAKDLYVAGDTEALNKPEDSQLDFQVGQSTLVVVRMHGDHWEFQNAKHGIRTAQEQQPAHFSHPKGLALDENGKLVETDPDEPTNCICFVAGPGQRGNIKVNLHINFVDYQKGIKRQMPAIIDPTIPNTDGGPPTQNP